MASANSTAQGRFTGVDTSLAGRSGATNITGITYQWQPSGQRSLNQTQMQVLGQSLTNASAAESEGELYTEDNLGLDSAAEEEQQQQLAYRNGDGSAMVDGEEEEEVKRPSTRTRLQFTQQQYDEGADENAGLPYTRTDFSPKDTAEDMERA